MKKRLLIDNNTICIEDENENFEIKIGTAYEYHMQYYFRFRNSHSNPLYKLYYCAGGKKEEMKKRLLLDNDANIPESICLSPSALSTMSAITPFSSIERTQQIETQLQQDANYNHLSPVKEGEVEDLESYKKRKRDKSQTKVDLPITNKRRRGRKENTRVSKK